MGGHPASLGLDTRDANRRGEAAGAAAAAAVSLLRVANPLLLTLNPNPTPTPNPTPNPTPTPTPTPTPNPNQVSAGIEPPRTPPTLARLEARQQEQRRGVRVRG